MSERRAVFGTIALSLGQAAKLGLQFAILPVLAHMLDPSAYGLVALAMPFVLLANMVSDAGLGNALVRVQAPSPALESTVFWLSVGICAVLMLLLWALAWPASQWMQAPGLPPVMMALSGLLVLGGSLSVANARIMRERRFAVFAAGDVAASALSAAAAIAAALNGFGAWSLVIQQLVLWVVKAVWVSTAAGFCPKFVCSPSLAKPFLSFGLFAAASNVVDFIGKNAPTVLIGGVLGVLATGRYSMSLQLTRMPDSLISGPIYLAIFSAIARQGEADGRTAQLAQRGLRGVTTVVAPVFCGLALVADLVTTLFLGPRWSAVGPVLILLAPFGFLLCVYSIVGAVLLGLGRSKTQFRLTALAAAVAAASASAGAPFGLNAVAGALSLGVVLISPIYLAVVARELNVGLGLLAGELAPPLAATGVMALAVLAARSQMAPLNLWLQLAASVGLGLVSFALALGMFSGRRLLADLKSLRPQAAAGVS